APTAHANGSSSNGSAAPEPETALRETAMAGAWHAGARSARRTGIRPEAAERHVLVVEDDPIQRQHIVDLMEPVQAKLTAVSYGEGDLGALEDQRFDCVVLDLGLPGLSGWQVADHVKTNKALKSTPLLVYTAKDLTRKEELRLGKTAKSIVVKEVRSPERLREEVAAILDKIDGDSGGRPAGSDLET